MKERVVHKTIILRVISLLALFMKVYNLLLHHKDTTRVRRRNVVKYVKKTEV